MNAAMSSPGTTSGTPSSATTSSRPSGRGTPASAGIGRLEHLDRVVDDRLDEQQVVGRVEVEAERPVQLDVARAGVSGAGLVGGPAVATERRLDRIGRGEDEAVRAAVMAVGGEDHEWPLPDAIAWREELL